MQGESGGKRKQGRHVGMLNGRMRWGTWWISLILLCFTIRSSNATRSEHFTYAGVYLGPTGTHLRFV